MRYIAPYIQDDLKKKMVFVGGPRQCGKTTMAQEILKKSSGLYLNWDRVQDQKKILEGDWGDDDFLLVFDELHKYRKWKNLIKGYYDTEKKLHQFLVTGSARLDVYRKGGDSLLGRYHYWRLHPFSLYEIPKKIKPEEAFRRLLKVGGFPEPFLDNSEREARRWREERNSRILKDDIRDLEGVKQIGQMGLLLEMLKSRVGSLISMNSIAEDLQVSPLTVEKWIEIFERMYLVFTVRPYAKSLPRGIKKAFKVYFYDIADVDGDEGARYENLVALHLLQQVHFWQDYQGYKMNLCFIRDKEKREVDFAVVKDGLVQDLIEAKWSDESLSPSLLYFGEKLRVKKITQLVAKNKKDKKKNNFLVTSPVSYFSKIKTDL